MLSMSRLKANGEFDCCCIFAAPPIIKDGKMHFYYMGGNGHHTNFRETSFGCVTYDEDKFAYIAPTKQNENATVVTSAVKIEGNNIWVLADFDDNASLKAAVCAGSKYDPKNGFAFEDSKLIKEDNGWTRLTFEKPLSELGTGNCCVHFELKNVKLYAMKGDVTCVSNKY